SVTVPRRAPSAGAGRSWVRSAGVGVAGGLTGSPGARDHLVQRVAHPPVEVARRQLAVRDDACRVAGATPVHLRGEVDAGDLTDRVHDLTHRAAGAAA